jgi:predicted metal-dependent hydrolase
MSASPREAMRRAGRAAGSGVARGLRRIVDALQRGLFDDVEAPTAASPSAELAPIGPPRARLPFAPFDPAPTVLRHPRATRELVLEGQRVAFLLRRSRRRSIGFLVGLEGLSVSAPKWVGLREIDAAVRERGGWILARLAEQRERAARVEAGRIVWKDGVELPYLGRKIRVVLDGERALGDGEVALDPAAEGDAQSVRELHVGLPRDASAERLRDSVQSWLQREALALFEKRSRHFAGQLGVRVTKLSLSSAQTRWGSAHASGAVRLHWRLIHFPMSTIDYVVAHELAHLREMNHSARFWDVVRSVVPEYRVAKAQLSREALASWD